MWRFFQKPVGQVVANTTAIVATTAVAKVTYNAGASVSQFVYNSYNSYNSSWFKGSHQTTTETAQAPSSDSHSSPLNFK